MESYKPGDAVRRLKAVEDRRKLVDSDGHKLPALRKRSKDQGYGPWKHENHQIEIDLVLPHCWTFMKFGFATIAVQRDSVFCILLWISWKIQYLPTKIPGNNTAIDQIVDHDDY